MKTIIAPGKLHLYASRRSHDQAFQHLAGHTLKHARLDYKSSKIIYSNSVSTEGIKIYTKPNFLLNDYVHDSKIWYVGVMDVDDTIDTSDYSEIESMCSDMCVVPVFLSKGELTYSDILYDISQRKVFKYVFNVVDHEAAYKAYHDFNSAVAEKVMSITDKNDNVWITDHSMFLLPMFLNDRNVHVSINIPFTQVIASMPRINECLLALMKSKSIDMKTQESYDCFKTLITRLKFTHTFVTPNIQVLERGIDLEYINNITDFLSKNPIDVFRKDDNLVVVPVYSPDHLMCAEVFVSKHKQDVTIILVNMGDLDLDTYDEIYRLSEYMKMNELCNVYTFVPKNDIEMVHLIMQASVVFHPKLEDMCKFLGVNYVGLNPCDYTLAALAINDKFNQIADKEDVGDIKEYAKSILKQLSGAQEITSTSKPVRSPIYLNVKHFNSSLNENTGSRIIDYSESKSTSEDVNLANVSRKIEQTHVSKPASTSEIQQIINKIKQTDKRAFIFDYDGTLVPITKNPSDAKPDDALINLLKELSKKARVVICTGRPKEVTDEWIPAEIEVFAEHSSFRRVNGEWISIFEQTSYSLEQNIATFFADRTPGSWIEPKEAGFTYHYSESDPEIGEKQALGLYSLLIRLSPDKVCIGKGIIEYKLSKKDKCLEYINEDVFLLAGDDKTDEDLFKKGDNITVKIGKGDTSARYRVNDSKEFRMLIEAIMRNI